MKATEFHYKCGKAETRIPWFPPDPEFLNAWRDEFFRTPGISDYTFWLCGAVMEAWPTNDVDILVTGEITSYQVLENILYEGMQLGFKHRLLIDIAWNDYYKKYLERGRCERRAICCDYFYRHGYCTLEECTAVAHDIETIVLGNEVFKNGEIITQGDPEAIQLSDSLWKIKMKSPSDKQIHRMIEGRIYTYSPMIITKDLDFKTVVNWP